MKGSTIKAITGDPALSEGSRVVLVLLFAYADFEDGSCYPSNAELRKNLGDMSERTLKRHLADLSASGAIFTSYNHAEHKRTIRINLGRYVQGFAPITDERSAGAKSDTYQGPSVTPEQVPNRVKAGAKSRKEQVPNRVKAGAKSDTPNKNTPENTPENTPLTPPLPPTGGAGGGGVGEVSATPDPEAERRAARGLETVAEATDGEVQPPSLPPVKVYPPDEVARVVAAVDELDPFQALGWSTLARQRIGQYSPAWVLEACQQAHAAHARHFGMVDSILIRFDRQGGTDREQKAKRYGGGNGYGRPEVKLLPIPPERPREPEILRYEDMTPEQIEEGRRGLEELKARIMGRQQA